MASSENNMDKLLDAYLDQQLTDKERLQFEESVKSQPELAEQIELQAEIDASLQRTFTPPSTPRLNLPSLASLQADETVDTDTAKQQTLELPQREHRHNSEVASARSDRHVSRRLVLAALATTAAIACFYLGSEFFVKTDRAAMTFTPRPLTEVYQECVDDGFMPYWVCDDEVTFAKTFEVRQGVPLKLAEMPPSQQMVGLAYLNGLSRKSTSMLALVDEQPVIVFIDTADNDWQPTTGEFSDVGLTVTRTEKSGLVFYEVSPNPNSDVVKSVVVATSSPSR